MSRLAATLSRRSLLGAGSALVVSFTLARSPVSQRDGPDRHRRDCRADLRTTPMLDAWDLHRRQWHQRLHR